MLTLLLLTLVHVVCCLSHVKCYSWVHTIIFCILVTILGWPMILTQYMLPRTESYLFSSLFSFYEMQRVYLWLLISLSSSQPPAYQVTRWAIHSSSCWILSVTTWCSILSVTYHFILYILVTILGWPMILTQYMLSRTESYFFFFFVFLLWDTASVPMTSDFPQL